MTQRIARPTNLSAHRLLLSAAEFEVLRDTSGLTMPPGFDQPVPLSTKTRQAAIASLAARAVITAEPDDEAELATDALHPSVAANLVVLARPEVLIRTDVSLADGALLAVHTIAGQLGASLFAAVGGGAELSMFAATDLGRELTRVVPAPQPQGPRIGESLGEPASDQLTGRLPLAALEDPKAATGEHERLAGEVDRRTNGVLRTLVTAPPDSAETGLRVGQVVWLATNTGWVGARPETAINGERMVSLEPVQDADLGAWVAPYIPEVLA